MTLRISGLQEQPGPGRTQRAAVSQGLVLLVAKGWVAKVEAAGVFQVSRW